jgi:hypothetical protein
MIPIIAGVISAIPSIIKLFDSDDRDQGVKELTNTVVKEAGKALGVDFKSKDEVVTHLNANPQDAIKLREVETQHLQKMGQLQLDGKLAVFRHEETIRGQAHDSYRIKSNQADKIADQIIVYNLPVIALLVLANVVIVHFLKDEATLIAISSQVIGIAIGKLFAERQAIVNFFFGSSMGSKEKDLIREQK